MGQQNQSLFNKANRLMVLLFLTQVFISSCKRSLPEYPDFVGQKKEYYAAIARACDDLLSSTNKEGENSIDGDDKILPNVLLSLHATTIKIANRLAIGTNQVSSVTMIFGQNRPDFVITWSQNDYGNGNCPWELAINADGPYTIVFSTNMPSLRPK